MINTSFKINGNFQQVLRNGLTGEVNGTPQFGQMDNLDYDYYTGTNQLQKVTDAAVQDNSLGVDYKGAPQSNTDYAYDDNGNLRLDMKKGISDIVYNCLNLPAQIYFSNGNKIEYLYDANGTKIKKRVTEGSNITETLYNLPAGQVGGTFVYKREPSQSYELDYIITEEGRLTPTIEPNVYKIEYYLKDHLGNVRAILTDSETEPGTPELIQQSHYYPFGQEFMGMTITQTGDVNNYKYNGKELQTELGLDWYDYGARFYDSQLGRFHTLDLLCEKYSFQSPFVYAINNPIRFTDFFGLGPDDTNKPSSFISSVTKNDETGITTIKETTTTAGSTSVNEVENEDGTITKTETTKYDVILSATEVNEDGEIISNSASSYSREKVAVTNETKDGNFISGYGEDSPTSEVKKVEGGYIGNKTEALALGVEFDSKINERLKRDFIINVKTTSFGGGYV